MTTIDSQCDPALWRREAARPLPSPEVFDLRDQLDGADVVSVTLGDAFTPEAPALTGTLDQLRDYVAVLAGRLDRIHLARLLAGDPANEPATPTADGQAAA